jgi:type II secretory ATPase GspE/PulE/Tfp pilus assembly ATPase PilB-like protein
MEQVGIRNGMVTMAQDGLLKDLDGLTSIEEVFRVAE